MFCLNFVKMKIFLLYISVFLFLWSCEQAPKQNQNSPKWSKEQSTALSQSIAKEEEIAIKLYLKNRPDWKMTKTASGLRYWIYEQSDGELPNDGDIVKVAFEIRLLNDSLCYQTEKGENSKFMVNKSDVESGIMEGVKLMPEGSSAKFILPSHLGHGLLGDFDKIPPLEVLVFDLTLNAIQK